MKRTLVIAFLSLGLTLAMATTVSAAPGAEVKPHSEYGYEVFDLQKLTAAPAVDMSNSGFYSGVKIFMKSLKARTTNNDTVANAGTKTQYADFGYSPKALTIQIDLNKISGTAAGKVILEASVDGINYVRIAKTDSLIIANVASQRKIFIPDALDLRYRYFQTKTIGTGTQSVRVNSFGYVEQ